MALGLLAGCGGNDDSPAVPKAAVSGTATVVPGTAASAAPTSPPGQTSAAAAGEAPRALPARFSAIAPAPDDDRGYLSSPAIAYDLGQLVARQGGASSVFVTPVRGWIRYPLARTALDQAGATDRFPIVVLLHGMHGSASPSYQGYDYLAENLASHGYVVVSIDANAINALETDIDEGDVTSQSRAQLVLGTLDRLTAINANGGPGVLNELLGKLDFTRVGILGHSRGGQGIAYTLKFNLTRVGVSADDLQASLLQNPTAFSQAYPDLAAAVSGGKLDSAKFNAAVKTYNIFYAAGPESIPPYTFKAAFMLAPTDFSGTLGLVNVPLGVLLPSCDGDVSDLEGARTFDHNRFSFDTDTAARHQVLVRGANHNFYNTVWTRGDDDNPRDDDVDVDVDVDDNPDTGADNYCAYRPGGIRLDAQDQQRTGLFLINSFMRLYVGGEQQFAAYWNGHARAPDAACPAGKGPCDARMVVTTQRDAGRRLLVQRFASSDSLTRNLLGGGLTLSGFDAAARCSMPYGAYGTAGDCVPNRLDGFEYQGFSSGPQRASHGLQSIADHLELSWSKPGASVSTDLQGISAQASDSLSFRVAVVRPMGQEIVATLTDAAGRSASVTSSDFSDALYLGPQEKAGGLPLVDAVEDGPFANGSANMLLNMVSIPLDAFGGVDTAHLARLSLAFPKSAGKVALADIEFQTLRR